MARVAKFAPEQIVEVTARLAADDGPGRATIARIAESLGAPTGSIYHRFASRDVLLGEVWIRAAESFQERVGDRLAGEDAWEAGLAAALFVPARVREAPGEARILLLHRREDFLSSVWPRDLAARAAALKRRMDAGLRDFARRALGRTDADALRLARYVVADAPLAAVMPHLRAHEAPPPIVDALVRATYVAVMSDAGARRPGRDKRAGA